jgi:hypothetical protein
VVLVLARVLVLMMVMVAATVAGRQLGNNQLSGTLPPSLGSLGGRLRNL